MVQNIVQEVLGSCLYGPTILCDKGTDRFGEHRIIVTGAVLAANLNAANVLIQAFETRLKQANGNIVTATKEMWRITGRDARGRFARAFPIDVWVMLLPPV